MKIVFTWIQGCWKGTQARFLVENHWFTLLEMGQCLRNIASSWTKLWNEVKETIESWALTTPEIVGEIMKETLEKQTNNKLILDWFVRNTWNKASLEKITTNYKVVFFNLSKEKAIDRLLWRMYNPKTGETFPSHISIDPTTWDELIKRKDDNEASILKRIDEFMTQTLSVVEEQRKEGKVIDINADQPVEDVAKEIKEKLGL